MLRLIVLAIIACCAAPLTAQSLRQLAAERNIRLGAAADPSRLNEAPYAATLSAEFSQLEPENTMKFAPIHPSPTAYNFSPSDALVSFARANNMAVRGHTLIWHNQNPGWLTNGGYTSVQLSSILQDHINTVVRRYAGQVYAWDVVNEAFNDNGTLRSTIWYNSPGIGGTGADYIEQAFRWARAADPQTLLFYNDYSAELTNAKSDAIYRMAQDFRSRGVPIDGIGMQMHLTTNVGSLASIESNMRRITDLGLQIHITELDVRIPVNSSGAAAEAALATQAQIYRDIVALCLKFPLCTSIQTWGFTDKYSWVPGSFPGMGAALLFDANYQPKPAYHSIATVLRTASPVIRAAGLTSAASYADDAVSPGEIVVLFDAGFGPASIAVPEADASGKLPSQFSDTRLLFDGVPAPILYTRVGQMSAVVPFSVAGSPTTQVQYEYRGVRSNPITVNVAATRPGIFTLDSSGQGDGAILDTAYRVISQTNPARRGEVILLFATGGGVTNPPSVDGQIAVSAPFPVVPSSVTARIGGIDCPIQYAGGASGLVAGALQINLQVARGVPSGPQPVVVTIGAATSGSDVTVWVE